jgi:hypothetical protein
MAPTPAKKTPDKKTELDVPVGFKTIFWVVVALTLASLVAAVFLATYPQQSETLREVVATCNSTWKMGFGGILVGHAINHATNSGACLANHCRIC